MLLAELDLVVADADGVLDETDAGDEAGGDIGVELALSESSRCGKVEPESGEGWRPKSSGLIPGWSRGGTRPMGKFGLKTGLKAGLVEPRPWAAKKGLIVGIGGYILG